MSNMLKNAPNHAQLISLELAPETGVIAGMNTINVRADQIALIQQDSRSNRTMSNIVPPMQLFFKEPQGEAGNSVYVRNADEILAQCADRFIDIQAEPGLVYSAPFDGIAVSPIEKRMQFDSYVGACVLIKEIADFKFRALDMPRANHQAIQEQITEAIESSLLPMAEKEKFLSIGPIANQDTDPKSETIQETLNLA